MKELLSYRAYARHRGCTLRAVQKAIEGKRIKPVKRNGKNWIDKDKADQEWDRNTDIAKQPMASAKAQFSDIDDELDDDLPGHTESEGQKRADEPLDETSLAYRNSRATRENIRVEREQLELDQLRGKLVSVDEAKRTAFTAFRALRDAILNVPPRVKDLCAAETDAMKVEQLLESELSSALNAFVIENVLKDSDDDEED